MRLLVVPARGGSKRIPRKNVKPFLGRPVIARVLETALASEAFDRVIVSTDDQEIAVVSRRAGAEVPFVRPATLADDHATTRQVVLHALDELAAAGETPDVVGCLYPTAVFATADHLRAAVALLDEDPAVPMVVTVGEHPRVVLRALVLRDGRLEAASPQYRKTRTQDLPPAYYDAGQFYVGRRDRWTDTASSLVGGGVPLVIEGVVDIDTEDDWRRAEELVAAREGAPTGEAEG